MYIPKRYGLSRDDKCTFCEKKALVKNKQHLLVCKAHKDSMLPDIRCSCGSWLELKDGKFGPYFVCMNCGNMNLKKGLDILENQQSKKKVELKEEVIDPRNIKGFDYGLR
ncbi:MAG: hypothetical protein ABIJ34_05885 [archaeon]